MIHGWNILSDLFDETSLNPIKTIQAMKRGAELWKTKDQQIIQWANAGLNLEGAWNTANEIRERILQVPEGKALKPFTKFEEWSDRVLWEGIVRNAQLATAEIKTEQIKRSHPNIPEKDIHRMVAHYVNDLYGTLPHTLFASKNQREFLSVLFFARNWTISNLRLLTGAMGKFGTRPLIPHLVRHKSMSDEEANILGRDYRFHLLKGIFGMVVFANLINKVISGRWSFENETGHKLDIDTGMRDNRGRRIYLMPPIFRYIRDYFGWFTDPTRTMFNKAEPLLKQSIEQAFNFSYWQKDQIAKSGNTIPENIKNRVQYFLEGITPIPSFLEREGEVKTPIERIMPFTGTWVRRGLVGGDAEAKMREFIAKGKREEEKIDKDIDEFLQRGKIRDAINLMGESKRYTSAEGIKNRIQRFYNPVRSRYESMSKDDRIKFLGSLTSQQRNELMQLLTVGKVVNFGKSSFIQKYGGIKR